MTEHDIVRTQLEYIILRDILKRVYRNIMEIDTEICQDLVRLAGAGPEISWNKIPPTGVNIIDHYDSFWVKLTEGSKIIFQATQRVQPNYIICGTNVAAVIEVMRNFDGTGGTDGVGPHYIGTLGGKYKVYVVPLLDENTFVMGYKGSNFLETGLTEKVAIAA